MRVLLVSAALAASCNALSLRWFARANEPSHTALPLEHFNTPKWARPLTLDQALSGANASVTTIKPEDLQDAKNQVPTLVLPSNATLSDNTQALEKELDKFAKRQGLCSNVRTRVEWDNASNNDRQGYINAIKCLMNKPASGQFSTSRNRYDDLVGLHQILTPNVHGNAKFLLWHRYYTWTFESLLRDECGLTGPLLWFDETRYAGNYPASSIFSAQWFGSIDVGGGCVTNGQFANLALVYGPGSGNQPHCLSRNNDNSKTINTGNPIVDACNSRSDYADMAACTEGGAHAWGHNGIGAVMSDVYASPSDPVFFLHHGFIDRNFRIWQNNGGNARVSSIDGTDAGGHALTLNTKINVYDFRPDVTIGQVLDTRGSTLCYKYDY
ncbi:metal ion binding [Ascochyta rabiei]|uniref:Metal ion binding n=1 Tax=Didymella rabiei TaxID=5454 RepID=A0A163AGV4_DIDRA|nr:metal ion binding [Ascochyta rabiei]